MLELTVDNAADYLRRKGWIGSEPVEVEPLGWGVSNAVLSVRTPNQTFVLKQSRSQLRTRDAWFSNLDRVFREQEVMQMLGTVLPAPTVPKVLFSDRENFVFAMSRAPAGARVWKEMLLGCEIDQPVAARAGYILGLMHETTGHDTSLVEPFRDRTVFVQLRVKPFYDRIAERHPEVAEHVNPVVARLITEKIALCHGDYSPKNILVHDNAFTLVDYETAHYGDPSMDLGFFLSHIILKAIKNHTRRADYYDLTRSFWSAYAGIVQFRSMADLVQDAIEHFAICALARIDGTSPVEYLPEEHKRETVRSLSRQILTRRPKQWQAVLELCEACYHNQPC